MTPAIRRARVCAPISRARVCAPILTVACVLALAAPAVAHTTKRVLRPLRTQGDALVFNVAPLRGSHVLRASLRAGGRPQRVRVRRVQAALAGGRLRLHRPEASRSRFARAAAAGTELAVVVSQCGGSSSAYRDAVLGTPGLASYLRLDETAGATACDSAGTRSGTYVGGVALGRNGAIVGDPDDAVGLDGASGEVRVGSATPLNPTGQLSIEAWVQPRVLAASQTILRKDGQYLVRLEGDRLVFRLWMRNGSTVELSAPATIAATTWQQVAAVYDGAAMRLYVNGAQVASRSVAGSIRRTSNALYAGSSTGSYDFFAGIVDEVAVYDDALPADTIARHYALGSAAAPPSGATSPSPTPTPTPTATPTPTPTPTSSAFTATIDNPVPPGSFWAQTVAQHGGTVDPNSASMINTWLNALTAASGDRNNGCANGTCLLSTQSWGYRIFMTTGSDPTYSLQSSCIYACDLDRLGPVPIPTGATPSPDGDAHIAVLDPSGKYWGMWRANWTGSTWTAGCGEAINLATEHLEPSGNCGATNGDIPQGVIGLNPRELASGHIDHPLAFASPGNSGGRRCPTPDGADNTNGLPSGAWLTLDPNYNIDGSSMTSWEKTIAHALQTYGAYYVDNNGQFQFTTEVNTPNQWSSLLGWTQPYVYMDSAFGAMLRSMRVMRPPC